MEIFILGGILLVSMWTVDLPPSEYKKDETDELI